MTNDTKKAEQTALLAKNDYFRAPLLHSGPADGVVFDEIFELRFLGACQSCKLYGLSFDFSVGIQDFAHRKIRNLLEGYAIKFQVIVGHNF